MFTRPRDLTDDEVSAALASAWGLDVASVEHAPVGFGSHHWWVDTPGEDRWFATADDLRTRWVSGGEPLAEPLARLTAALATAAALRDSGHDWVVAPRRSERGEVVVRVGEAYALSVYPRVTGGTFGWGPYDDPALRTSVLDRLVALHTTAGCRDVVASDDLGHALVARLRQLVDEPGAPWDGGPFSRAAWRLVVDRGARLGALVDRYERLVGDVDPARFVITHGEPHRGNTVVTDTGLVLVDWDTCLLAPCERDLWMLVGEDPGIGDAYARRSGTALDPRLLEAFRLRWDLADVESCVAELRAPHTEHQDTRTAWDALRAVLAPDPPP